MENFVQEWLFDPTMARLIAAAVGLIAVYVVVSMLNRTIGRYIADNEGGSS